MYSYDTFNRDKNGSWTLKVIKPFKQSVGEKLVDDSKYRPNQPILKQVNGSCADCIQFDFPDGKIDNELGAQMAFLRRRGLTKSEFDNYLRSLENLSVDQREALKDELKNEIKKKLEDKALENLAKSQDNSSTSDSSDSSGKA